MFLKGVTSHFSTPSLVFQCWLHLNDRYKEKYNPICDMSLHFFLRTKNLDSFSIIDAVITVSELMELHQCMSAECFPQKIFCIMSISHIFEEYSSSVIVQLANYPVLHVETTNENSFLLWSDDFRSQSFFHSESASRNVFSVFKIYIT